MDYQIQQFQHKVILLRLNQFTDSLKLNNIKINKILRWCLSSVGVARVLAHRVYKSWIATYFALDFALELAANKYLEVMITSETANIANSCYFVSNLAKPQHIHTYSYCAI